MDGDKKKKIIIRLTLFLVPIGILIILKSQGIQTIYEDDFMFPGSPMFIFAYCLGVFTEQKFRIIKKEDDN